MKSREKIRLPRRGYEPTAFRLPGDSFAAEISEFFHMILFFKLIPFHPLILRILYSVLIRQEIRFDLNAH